MHDASDRDAVHDVSHKDAVHDTSARDAVHGAFDSTDCGVSIISTVYGA